MVAGEVGHGSSSAMQESSLLSLGHERVESGSLDCSKFPFFVVSVRI